MLAKRGRFKWVVPSAVLIAGFYALFRQQPFPQLFDQSDKVAHFLLFAAGFWLVARSLRSRRGAVLVLGAALALAIGAEFLQGGALLPFRHFSMEDMAANLAGLLAGSLIWMAGRAV